MRRASATVKKAYNLPPELVQRVKKITGARTETEAIVRCMTEVAFMAEVELAAKEAGGRFPEFKPLR